MESRSRRWTLAVLLFAIVIAAVAGAAWAGPAKSALLDEEPPAGVEYETIEIAPIADTYIYAWDADRNYGENWSMYLRSADLSSALMQFELDEVPVGPNVTIATGILHVYVASRTNGKDIMFAPCQLLRPWLASEATWNVAATGKPWQAAGANGALDRAGAISAPTHLTESGMWVELDVTELVRAWYSGEAENYGVILKSMPGGAVTYEMVASESMYTDLHPFLEVTYGVAPEPTPTATPLPLLDVTKTGPEGPLEVSGNEVISYEIVVANNRDYDFTNVMITDALPLGTEFLSGSVGAVYDEGFQRVRWAVPELASGQAVTLSLSLGVPSWVKADGNVVNVVRANCVECWSYSRDMWEIPVNIAPTPIPTLPPPGQSINLPLIGDGWAGPGL